MSSFYLSIRCTDIATYSNNAIKYKHRQLPSIELTQRDRHGKWHELVTPHTRTDLSIFIRPIKDNLNAIGHAVGQDSETKITEHCPKYKQSTVI